MSELWLREQDRMNRFLPCVQWLKSQVYDILKKSVISKLCMLYHPLSILWIMISIKWFTIMLRRFLLLYVYWFCSKQVMIHFLKLLEELIHITLFVIFMVTLLKLLNKYWEKKHVTENFCSATFFNWDHIIILGSFIVHNTLQEIMSLYALNR